ncbi:MAG: HD domain-containing protein [Hyphomicrobiales bacterium]|nr:HD domain-containing protein [Hyphomicrobiales bacterium]MCP5370262.1 HD domain-containing protein [Hyphomicrobiales bacterium]
MDPQHPPAASAGDALAGTVTLVHGGAAPDPGLVALLACHHVPRPVPVAEFDPAADGEALLHVFDLDLGDRAAVTRLHRELQQCAHQVPRLFALESARRRDIVQALSLGADDYLVRPLDHAGLSTALAALVNRAVERRWEGLNPVQSAALKTSLKVFEDSLAGVQGGAPLPVEAIKESCDLVVRATAEDSLADWMQAVRAHHNYTYRHSMMVCGLLVAFGHHIGIRGEELQRLTVGGMLHDIGKAFVPLELLDKPSRLDPDEWEVMRSHPVHSRMVFQSESVLDLHPDVIDAAVHHHEKLDGTGYPDGLAGAQIRDMARMVAICDVHSGLIDKRAYKAAMTAQEALDIMRAMDGHLDLPLVAAFAPVAQGAVPGSAGG